jgi:hypothetical protein
MKGSVTRLAWHRWQQGGRPGESTPGLTADEFFKAFQANGKSPKEYLYWSGSGDAWFQPDPRQLMCELMAHKAGATRCSEQAKQGENQVWLNSRGVVARPHFDREENINVQLKGEKKWVLWAPHQLEQLCFHPYAHPANRQVSADLGSGMGGALCASAVGIPNRTVTVKAGDVLLIPPYYVHKVETLTPSVNYNVWYGSDQRNNHDVLMRQTMTLASAVLNRKSWQSMDRGCNNHKQQECARTEQEVRQPRAQAAAGLRVIIRYLVSEIIPGGKAAADSFLQANWATHFAELPDIGSLRTASTDNDAQLLAEMCAEEVGGKRRKYLVTKAEEMVVGWKKLLAPFHHEE